VGRKGAPTTSKKESLREWKTLMDKNKKQGASSSNNETSEKGVVHHIGVSPIVSAKSWESIASSDDDDELLPNIGSTSLTRREC